MSRLRILLLLPLVALLGGCNFVVMNPAGDIAVQQRDLVVVSVVLMLLIIIPVMFLIVFFAWKYRQANTEAKYEPDWDHSTHLELVIWAMPLLIIICLGAITWSSTHLLDPYRRLDRIAPGNAATLNEPLVVEVVALDWKWLFIYPEYGVAAVNELAAPVDRQIRFKITATSVMNSFYIPALAGQIYAMPGMETKLHAVINKAGKYDGFSANYSGAGFSNMRFAFHGVDQAGFDAWIAKAKGSQDKLSRDVYLELEKPSEKVPVKLYNSVDADLYKLILNMCAQPGKMCMSEMMAIDSRGGMGLASARNILPLKYNISQLDGSAAVKNYVASVCTVADAIREAADRTFTPGDSTPVTGVGLSRPGRAPAPLQFTPAPPAERRASNT
ncbi:ubiquinol oxidase subunit II [Tardiphaga alba]|uniref:Ubiquinol oxidase polypeptide II n=1 Tax=Tardiphaga alba TaxID=340268 RepID=A0ABX8AEI6_9BRAD|nr:ubiquinol oxidase subunit II [Tardiphaga alba]